MALAEYIRNFRRRMFDSAAAIFWMYNDCWPATRSWTIVDYYGRRTPSLPPGASRLRSPCTVALAVDEDHVRVFGVNDGAVVERAKSTSAWSALAGGLPGRTSGCAFARWGTRRHLAEPSPWTRWRNSASATHAAFAVLYRDGQEVARGYIASFPGSAEMRVARCAASPSAAKIEGNDFRRETFAWRVCLDLDGEARLPDNFLDLLPGRPYEVDWPTGLGEPRVLRVGNREPKPGRRRLPLAPRAVRVYR